MLAIQSLGFPSTSPAPGWVLLAVGLLGLGALVAALYGGSARCRWQLSGLVVGVIPASLTALIVVERIYRAVVDEAPLVGLGGRSAPDHAAWERLEDTLPLVVPLEEAIGACVAAVVLLAFFLIFRAMGKHLHPTDPPTGEAGSAAVA
jgi:hypothetical protein